MAWKVRIGINPLSWMNDDMPSLGGEVLLDTALREGKQIGYEGFELGNKFPPDGPGLKAKLGEFGLACVSGWYSGFLADTAQGLTHAQALDAEIERCHPHMSKLQHNGASVVVYGECAGSVQGLMDTSVGKRPQFTSDAQWVAYAERLNAFGEHLRKSHGLKLAYHHHMGAYVESPADIDKLMALTDPAHVFLLFDTGHAFFGGAQNPVDLLTRHVQRVAHVHCKDVRSAVVAQARNGGWSFLSAVLNGAFTVPGDGDLDFADLLSVLRIGGYQGWLVVEAEQDPAVAPSHRFAKKGYQTLRRLVDALH